MKLQLGGRLLIATHLEQSNNPVNQKHGAVNKRNLTVFIRLLQGSSRALERRALFQGHIGLPANSLDFTAVPHRRFPLQGHILSAGGDALRSE